MVAATLMWIAESAGLREPLQYCHLFGEIVHSQIALAYAYLKAMPYQCCCMVQAVGKSPNQSPPNFMYVNRCLRSIIHIYWPNYISNMNLLKMAKMQQIDIIIKKHKLGWIVHTLRKDESSVARQAMQWNPLHSIGRRKERSCETWRRTV